MLCIGAFEFSKSSFLVAKRYGNRGDQRCRDVSLLPRLNKLSKNVSRLGLAPHAHVGDGKAATRQTSCLLRFGVKCDRFRKIAFLAIGSGQDRIQIKVIWIELECPLAFNNCIVSAVVSEVGSSGNVAGDRRYGIEFLGFEDKLETVF